MIYTQLKVYQVAYELLHYLYQACSKVRREYRYTLAEDVKRDLIDVMLEIYRANGEIVPSERLRHIHLAQEHLVGVRVRIRLLHDLRELSERKYLHAAQLFTSVSKQLSSWAKYIAARVEE